MVAPPESRCPQLFVTRKSNKRLKSLFTRQGWYSSVQYRAHEQERPAMIDPNLLDILVCPVSKAPLIFDERKNELMCKASGLAYPVRDGIPVMLEEEARTMEDDELRSL
jgi:uncharacterized protein YbaR (Trm112 family)